MDFPPHFLLYKVLLLLRRLLLLLQAIIATLDLRLTSDTMELPGRGCDWRLEGGGDGYMGRVGGGGSGVVREGNLPS